ncbi:MAG: glycosyltransferase family 4 protein [Candidatus Bathyarchaeota archaeon]|nr:MAG: glycosyltransferase family 4 protein [Candidatus Bathyarchaeota archaeon]
MHVLMISPSFYPIEGGTETMVQNISTAIKDLGVEVDIMTFNMDQKWHPRWSGAVENRNNLKIFKIPGFNWLPFINHSPRITSKLNVIPGRFTHMLKEYDVLHFHEAEFSFPFFSFFVKKRKILHLHAIDFDYFNRYHFSRLLLKNTVDMYLSLTNKMKEELIALGVAEQKINVLPNAIDTKIFQSGGKKNENTLLYVGRIVPEKGLHVLLRSLKYVNHSVTLTIIGPSGWDLNYCQNIFRLIEIENQRGKHVIQYIGGFAPNHPELIAQYQQASIFILPSFREAFGVVLLEAMACETPVIATQTGGVPEIVRNGENGILVSVNNYIELARAIDYLLDNEDIRLKLGKQACAMVKESYSIDVVANRLYDIYQKIICA